MNDDTTDKPDWHARVYGSGGYTGCSRRRPRKSVANKILQEQNHRCLYCGLPFGSTVMRGGRTVVLSVRWDHYIPYAYQQANSGFVAACQICNGIKCARMFTTLEEHREAIMAAWRRKGYSVVSEE